jgi:hypothetical protein
MLERDARGGTRYIEGTEVVATARLPVSAINEAVPF